MSTLKLFSESVNVSTLLSNVGLSIFLNPDKTIVSSESASESVNAKLVALLPATTIVSDPVPPPTETLLVSSLSAVKFNSM